MQHRRFFFTLIVLQFVLVSMCLPETSGSWRKYENNPVLGGDLGTCFDVAVLRDGRVYKMYFSWRPRRSLALVESTDGIHWSDPRIVLDPRDSGWEERINRPGIVKRDDTYHMWYTGQTKSNSYLGYANSTDGIHFKRAREHPVLSPEEPWEKVAVMCPHVMWDPDMRLYRMWYSAGDQYEPNAIGYAISQDGLHWQRWGNNPVFRPDKETDWEKHKVTACQVVHHDEWYVMFYIGFSDEHTAHIGLARSRNGITGWERHPANPIVAPDKGSWDAHACYKPFALYDRQTDRWLLWYNGRHKRSEQIGLAIHKGADLEWDSSQRKTKMTPESHIHAPDSLQSYVGRLNKSDEELNSQHGKKGFVTIATIGPRPLTVSADAEPNEVIQQVIAHWRAQFARVLPDRPDLIVVPEACNRPRGHSRDRLNEYYRVRKNQVRDFFSEIARKNRCYLVYSAKRTMPDGTWRNSSVMIDRRLKLPVSTIKIILPLGRSTVVSSAVRRPRLSSAISDGWLWRSVLISTSMPCVCNTSRPNPI